MKIVIVYKSRYVSNFLFYLQIDSEPNPPQFYEQLYNNGIGTMVADLYLCWAHYYDYCDNFEKAEGVYRKGLDARAQPIELIEQAHRQFGFLMSQRLLYKDETTQRQFRTSMDEQRVALTSLRRHRHVGSIRTGSAVKSHEPGRVEQHTSLLRQSNRKVQVFEDAGDAPTSPGASTSVVQSIMNSEKKKENLREPGPWSKAKIKSHALFTTTGSSKPSFPILEDDDCPPISLPDNENNFKRGIQLPKDFVRKSAPQDDFLFPMHRDEEPAKNTLYRYDKFMVFPAADKSYSLEELWAYKWFQKRNIKNNFTRTQDRVWETGYSIPIRLPPHFARKNAPQDDVTFDPINFEETLANGQRKFGFNIDLIYMKNEEFSTEEILQSKWLNGEMKSQKDAEMDLTCAFERRIEISNRNASRRSMVLGGRKSILPRMSISPRESIGVRKSLAPPTLPDVLEEPKPAHFVGSLPKRKSVYTAHKLDTLSTINETASPPISRRKLDDDNEVATGSHARVNPIPFNIFEDSEHVENNDQVFKVPQSAAPLQKTRFSTGFQDEDLDGCTTQTFNFFIKSQAISTPKVEKQYAKLSEPESVASLQKGLDFGSDDDKSLSDDQNAVKQPFACRSTDMDQQYMIEPPEIYRQKLSAIMETTEECATVSSLAATASSKSSSAEDFDFTKHTNHQSSVAMSTYRQHTMINNTAAKMSSSNVSSVGNRENETKKSCAFEIYQEDAAKENDTVPSQLPTQTDKIADSPAALNLPDDIRAFDKTLPSAAQFHIYEDGEETKIPEAKAIEANESKLDTTLVNKIDTLTGNQNQSVFEMTQCDTVPSTWHTKAGAGDNVSLLPSNKSISKMFYSKMESNSTLITGGAAPKLPLKSGFNVLQEDTGLTIPVINFAEERTAQIPAMPTIFNQSHLAQMVQPEPTEHISMFIPEIPDMADDDETKNISKIIKNNASKIEPPQPMNQSVFQFAAEDTTQNTFSTHFNDDKLGTNPNIPNPMQISLFNAGGNNSAIPMIPDMPTLPEIDFRAGEISTHANIVGQSKLEASVAGGNKMSADQSLFKGFSQIEKEKTAEISIANKTATKCETIDDDFFAMINKTGKEIAIRDEQPSLAVPPMPMLEQSLIKPTEPIDNDKTVTTNMPTIYVSPEKETSKFDNPSMSIKSKQTIDDEFYALIRSPVRKTERTLAEGMIFIDTPPSQPAQAPPRHTDVKANPHKFSIFQNPSASTSLLEPMMKNDSVKMQTTMQSTQTILPSNRKSSLDDMPHAFSDDNPNTAMFSLHMPFIKNSTILMASTEHVNNITDEMKTNLTLTDGTALAKAQGKQ